MIPPVENVQSFPTRCPFPSCRKKLHKEWVLGLMPKFLGMMNAVIRCKACERVYAFTMPVTAVEPFIDSLPRDKTFPFDISDKSPKPPITNDEISSFSKKPISPRELQDVMEAFSVLDEYDALGYFGNTDRGDEEDQSDTEG